MPTDINRINTSVLKNQRTLFNEEKNHFKNVAFNTFTSSYFYNCSDTIVRNMASNLEKLYKKIDLGYLKIDEWWSSYNKNVEALENYLAQNGSLGSIEDATIRNCVKSKIEDLEAKELDQVSQAMVASTVSNVAFMASHDAFNLDKPKSVETYAKGIGLSVLNDVGAFVSDPFGTAKSLTGRLVYNAGELLKDVSPSAYGFATSAVSFFKDAGVFIKEMFKKVGATVTVTGTSILKGLSKLIEGIVDANILVATVTQTPLMMFVDFVTDEKYNIKDTIWKKTKANVSKDYTSTVYDKLYDTKLGDWIKANSLVDPYGKVAGFLSGTGYVAGVLVISVFTGGLGLFTSAATGGATLSSTAVAAGISGIAGFGSNTEEAWNNGASTTNGLAYGTLMGGAEGLGMLAGMKINAFKLGKVLGKPSSKSINTLGRLALDSIDGASIGITDPLAKMTYAKDIDKNYYKRSFIEEYKKLFEEQGGWKNVGLNAAVGGAFSFLGETPDLFKNKNIALNKKPIKAEDKNLGKKVFNFKDLKQNNNIFKFPELTEANPFKMIDDVNVLKKFNNINELINNYLNDKRLLIQGISFEKYLKNNGINIINPKDNNSLATYFGDSKLYLYNKLTEALDKSPTGPGVMKLLNIYNKYRQMSVGDIDITNMLNDVMQLNKFQQFINPKDIYKCVELANNGLSDKLASTYSSKQLAAVYNYTSMGGLELNAWLNDTVIAHMQNPKRARDLFPDIAYIQDMISGRQYKRRQNRYFSSKEGSIIGELDSLIKNTNYDDAIITYRGVQDIYDNGKKIDINKLKKGDSFSTDGYQSSSVLMNNCYAVNHYNDHVDIILKVVVPPKSGAAAYIEHIGGCSGWCQTEMLIKRKAKMTVVDDVYTQVINGKKKTIVPVVVQ